MGNCMIVRKHGQGIKREKINLYSQTSPCYTFKHDGYAFLYLQLDNDTGSNKIYIGYADIEHSDGTSQRIFSQEGSNTETKTHTQDSIAIKKGDKITFGGTPTENNGKVFMNKNSYGYIYYI